MGVFFTLSVSDLLLVDDFKNLEATNDADGKLNGSVLGILYKNGMDISMPVKENFCQHRNLRNQIVSCIRYEGEERLDKEWKLSGSCSLEAYLYTDDISLRNELLSLDPKKSRRARVVAEDVEEVIE